MSAYKFRVLIDTDSSEEVFRDIIISENDHLENFYKTIVDAFNFKGDQMASFYKSNDDWDKGQEITLVDMGLNDDTERVLIMNETKLNEVVTEPNQKLILVHDFMRMWCFLIELVEVIKEKTTHPKVILSVGVAPDEDSKDLDSVAGLGMGETLDLGDDFDDIFSEDDFDDDDFGNEGIEEFDDNDLY